MKKIVALLFTFAFIFAQDLPRDPGLLSGTLENGFKYHIKQNALPVHTAYFYLVVHAGSTNEYESERGLAHFTEHMAFNGTRDFAKSALVRELERLGVVFGADLNAQTSYDDTIYKLKIDASAETFASAFKVLANWASLVSFDADELEKERGVVAEEERARNTPWYRLYRAETERIFGDSIYARRAPIGDPRVIKTVQAPQIRAFYERVYQPRFMELVAVGDFELGKIERLVKANFSNLKNTNDYAQPLLERALPQKSGDKIYRYDTSELGANLVKLSFEDSYVPKITMEAARRILLDSYVAGLISYVYERKNSEEKSLLRASFVSPSLVNQRTLHTFEINVVGEDFAASLSELYSLLGGVKEEGFLRSDFEVVKRNYLEAIKAQYERAKSKKSETIVNYLLAAIEGGATPMSDEGAYELNSRLLSQITLEDVNAEARRILSLPSSELCIYAAKSAAAPTGAQIAKIKSTAKPFKFESAKSLPSSLLSAQPSRGKIVSKKRDEEHDLWSYELSNGAKAVLKPLSTRKNRVLFSLVSKGGFSNLKNPKLGKFAVNLSNESGLGEFSNYDLETILAGKNIDYEKKIGALSQGFYGAATRDDLAALFEAVYADFTAPRLDEATWKRLKTLMSDDLQKSRELPEIKFEREFTRFYYDGNPRAMPLEESDFESVSAADLTGVLRQKFGGAKGFILVLAGDFDLKEAEDLLERYVASLPSGEKSDEFVDDGVRGIPGVHEFERAYQITQKSQISIMATNYSAAYSPRSAVVAEALNSVLGARLREAIREEKGETYGFGVHVKLSKVPYERAFANISFTCKPANARRVIKGVWACVDELKRGKIDARHVENFKKAALLAMERNLSEPSFWEKNIVWHELFGYPLFKFEEYKKLVESVSGEDIRNAAKTYFDNKNVTTSINSPKK